MPYSTHIIKLLEKVEPSLREVLVAILEEIERQREEGVTRREFLEFAERTEENFQRVWKSINELAEAQKKTEETLNTLTREFKDFKRQVGDITDTVGYTLENASYRALPRLLKKDYGVEVRGRLRRGYLKDQRGRHIEVNILGEGRKNGKKVLIVGESKARLSKKGVREFINERLKRFGDLYGEIFPVLVTHMISEHDVEEYAREHDIALYYSYEFE